jgi:hypothetical protein
MKGRILEAGHTTEPDHMPERAKNRLHPRGRPHSSGLTALLGCAPRHELIHASDLPVWDAGHHPYPCRGKPAFAL